jgi:hypothetical protein
MSHASSPPYGRRIILGPLPGPRWSASSGAQSATSSESGKKNRPRPLPRGTDSIPEWNGKPSFFTLPQATAITAATRQTLVPHVTLAELAADLSKATYTLLYSCVVELPSQPGEREAWARDVEKNARALLANFGMDPDTLDFSPSPDAFTVLMRRDYSPGPLRAESRWGPEDTRKMDWFLGAMQLPPYPAARMSQDRLEWLSLCGEVPTVSLLPEFEALRVALVGVAHVARQAARAAAIYEQHKRRPRQFTPERRFALELYRIYQTGFGKMPSSTSSGPAVCFYKALAQQLKEAKALPGADPERHRKILWTLKTWARSSSAVITQIRDVRAIEPSAGRWRRERSGRTRVAD